ncbi:hypothetical protein B0H67DRAFT_578204 [Lasiosphaeris hirsuta]|uniref:Uncharacterized protein n=1 Tax=Lasiosphaeris hirsuta TaxID=260670 RepID=A0AA40ASF4_9PEZI|nr:hypothetical protein B0H67DRAFT_578204 [Lasiosphaeris hirsuta]
MEQRWYREIRSRSLSPRGSRRYHEDDFDAESGWRTDDEDWSYVGQRQQPSLPDLRASLDEHVRHRWRKYQHHHYHSSHRPEPQPARRNGNHGHILGETENGIHPLHHSTHVPPVGNEYATWTDPVIFGPNDAVNHPREWLEKLEKLEAQVIKSGVTPSSVLHHPLPAIVQSPTGAQDYMRHHLKPVLLGVGSKISKLQRSHFCGRTINILVLEQNRPQVARLLDLSVSAIRTVISSALGFIERLDIFDLTRSTDFLRDCVDFLAWMGLRPRVLQEYQHDKGDGAYSRFSKRHWQYETVVSALLHALRAVTYTLDIAAVSFVGAHLEPFNQVYFAHPHETVYKIPCDAHATSFVCIHRRAFDCLAGMLGDTPAWVFETHERGQIPDVHHQKLYLHTSPEQLANIWGPVWRSEDRSSHGSSKYMLSRGFIVGGHSSPSSPAALSGEYLCHWTNNPRTVAGSPGLPRYNNMPSLLIGSHPALEDNRSCPTTMSEVRSMFRHHDWLQYLGAHASIWYLDSASVAVTASLPGQSLSSSASLIAKRRRGVTARDLICASLVAQPFHHLNLLAGLYGIQISGCTGNARRTPLFDMLFTRTMRELARTHCPWTHDHKRWEHFRHVLEPLDETKMYRACTARQRLEYDRFLKLAIGTFKDLPRVHAGAECYHALYACTEGEYCVRIPTEHHKWTGLLADELTTMACPVVELCCLECQPGGLTCQHESHHQHRLGAPGSVYETAVWLNAAAVLPRGLKPFGRTGVVTGDMVRSVPVGETLDMGEHGRLRVLAHVRVAEPHGYVLVVERKKSAPRWPRKVKYFFQKVNRQIALELYHAERIHLEERLGQCVYVLVVSDRWDREILKWLKAL